MRSDAVPEAFTSVSMNDTAPGLSVHSHPVARFGFSVGSSKPGFAKSPAPPPANTALPPFTVNFMPVQGSAAAYAGSCPP